MDHPNRKHPRLKEYDYSQDGFYYATIHLAKGQPSLSVIRQCSDSSDVEIELTHIGRIARQQLLALEGRYAHVRIDKYVIMPTHIHVIIQLFGGSVAQTKRESLTDILCAYKSLTTRSCNQFRQTPGNKLFQTSFFESVLRSEQDYLARWKYIDENPLKWTIDPEDL